MVILSSTSLSSLILIVTIITIFLSYKISVVNESFKNFTEIMKDNGYFTKEHLVTTEDGYQLTVFQIQKGKNCKDRSVSTPVLLMHGLFQTSVSYIDAGTNAGLAYLLSDACFDVWVGNTRGSYYARRHITLNPDKDEEFWNFSVDEIGMYDLPAKIDYILNFTKSSTVNYVGFSQGGSIPYIMCSELSEFCDKLGVIISLSPASRLINSRRSPFIKFVEIVSMFEKTLNKFGVYEVFPVNGVIQRAAVYICRAKLNAITRHLCQSFLSVNDAHNPDSITDDTLQQIFKHFPAGTSIRNIARYGQIYKTGLIRKYDFGEKVNVEKYGAVEPPVYNLKNIKTDILILHGRNDQLISIKDSEWIIGELPNSVLITIEDPLWNHFDMVYSQHTNKTIFQEIKKYLLKYSN